MKRLLTLLVLGLLTLTLQADSSYDRTIEVLEKSRDEAVKQVFRELINAYQDEDARGFFERVSEDRFLQDYVTFSDGIYQDFRYYDILQVDYWFERIVPKGVKRFVYVKWEKRYENLKTAQRYVQRGYSRFLFDEIEGKYYLIEVAGNHLWADSVAEWREEVPKIPGQEAEPASTNSLPDLTVENILCPSGGGGAMPVTFDIANIGAGATTSGRIEYLINGSTSGTYFGDLEAGETAHISTTADCYASVGVNVDPDDMIEESDETNNDITVKLGAMPLP